MVLSIIKFEREYINNLMFKVFFIQSIIILISYFNSDFHSFVQLFQTEIMIEKANSWGGIRTFMLASTAFFGLGVAYGLIYILFVYEKFIKNNEYTYKNIIFIGIIFIGGLFIARTMFIGLFFCYIAIDYI